MSQDPIVIRTGDAPDVYAFLDARIYEFNSQATGYFDGEPFSSTFPDEAGVIRAGTYGYTWGGCAYVIYLWVHESKRGRGVGRSLLTAVEQHAKRKGCELIFLATHSFQAPGFYERMGYERQSILQDHPVGHSSFLFAKRLQPKRS